MLGGAEMLGGVQPRFFGKLLRPAPERKADGVLIPIVPARTCLPVLNSSTTGVDGKGALQRAYEPVRCSAPGTETHCSRRTEFEMSGFQTSEAAHANCTALSSAPIRLGLVTIPGGTSNGGGLEIGRTQAAFCR